MEDIKVEVMESTLVAPSEETPRFGLWLSNLDLAAPRSHTPLVYYYPAPTLGAADFFSPHRLRAALARALVPFYPLAGRLGVDEGGRLQIDCNGEGALFVVARVDFAGEELFGNYVPSPELRRMLVPLAPSADPPCVLAMFQFFAGRVAMPGAAQLWNSFSPLKFKMHTCLALRGRCWTADRRLWRGLQTHTLCPLCGVANETMVHLALQ